jgi:REP element-mobilizing transposase RayT
VYFVTCCTKGRGSLLADTRDSRLAVNPLGKAVESCWKELPDHYPEIQLDEMVVMPDHMHGILILKPVPERSGHDLFEIVRNLKAYSARQINQILGRPGGSVWQRGFYHVLIQNRASLERIRNYIRQNPEQWEEMQINLAADWLRNREGLIDDPLTVNPSLLPRQVPRPHPEIPEPGSPQHPIFQVFYP